jgi:multidrug efflux pump subunit AcrA (membrane-fusion protein)
MKHKIIFFVLLVAAVGAGVVRLAKSYSPASATAGASGRKILYYQSAMHPWIKSDKPGKCPICGMDLVPIYAGEADIKMDGGVTLISNSITALSVQTATVARQPLVRTLRVAGSVVASSRTAAWFEFTAYERDFVWLKIGQTVEVSLPSVPGKTFLARIELHSARPFADADFDTATGSTKVRAEFSEPPVFASELGEKKLFNNLYAEGRVIVNFPDVLSVPRSAVLAPGAQAVVYVDAGGGHYEPRKIKTGRVGDELVEVLDGLHAGEKVVTTGNLLLDAETQISQSGN